MVTDSLTYSQFIVFELVLLTVTSVIWAKVKLISLFSSQHIYLMLTADEPGIYLVGASLEEWGSQLSADLHSDLWVPPWSLFPSHPPPFYIHSTCSRSHHASSCTSHSPRQMQSHSVITTDTTFCKQFYAMQLMWVKLLINVEVLACLDEKWGRENYIKR